MSPDYDADLKRLRDVALALPGAEEQSSHNSPGFLVEDGRFFAYIRHDDHAGGETAVMVRTSGEDEQTSLIERDPALYYRPDDLGPSGWIAIRTGAPTTDWDHIGDRVAQSWEMVAPRGLLEAGGR